MHFHLKIFQLVQLFIVLNFNQAKVLNLMLDEWVADEDEPLPGISGKKLKEKVGHTPVEVFSGALLGIVLALAIPM